MYMKKKSPLTPFIWQQIREMEERGITNILYHRHRIAEPNCKPIHAKGSSLGIEKMASLFVIIAFGFFSSLIIFLVVNYSPRHKLKKLCYKFCSTNGKGSTSVVPISEKSIFRRLGIGVIPVCQLGQIRSRWVEYLDYVPRTNLPHFNDNTHF